MKEEAVNSSLEQTALSFAVHCWPPATTAPDGLNLERLQGDGSDRIFIRIKTKMESALLVYGPDAAENRAYEAIGRHIWRLGRWGPEFLAVDRKRRLFLVEDLGSASLQDRYRDPDPEQAYTKTVELLAEFHHRGLDGFEPDWCHQTRSYDRRLILKRETDYFLSAFVRGRLHLAADPLEYAAEFGRLADRALAGAETVLIHRDFQSRNILLQNDRPRLVDFQGARLGPSGYDLASLLFDPYVFMPDRLREDLYLCYCRRRQRLGGFDRAALDRTFPFLAACRLMQALGAYGFLTVVKGKTDFASYITPATVFLERVLAENDFTFAPRLRELVREIKHHPGGGD